MKQPIFDTAWPEEIKALYKHDMEQTWDPTLMPHLHHEYRFLMATCRDFVPEDEKLNILDVGCAQATLALQLAEAGHKVVAVDIRQDFLDYAQNLYEKGQIRFVCGNVFEVDPGGPFDTVFVNQVIEHLLEPEKLLKHLSTLLTLGGQVVMTTPNGHYVKNDLPHFSDLVPKEDYLHLQYTADGDGHFFAYTTEELKAIFRDSGFTNIRVRCVDTPWMSGHMKFRYLHRFLPYGLLQFLNGVTQGIPVVGDKFSSQLQVSGRWQP